MQLADIADIRRLIASSPWHLAALRCVRSLNLPDWWIAAGFVRSAVWDALHSFTQPTPLADIDVIWFDPARASPEFNEECRARLVATGPHLPWSVKNQARMHLRNGDAPYRSAIDAMRYWAETVSAVAVTLGPDDAVEIAAPLGVEDLLAMVVRPTPHFRPERMREYAERQRRKRWRSLWPRVQVRLDLGDQTERAAEVATRRKSSVVIPRPSGRQPGGPKR